MAIYRDKYGRFTAAPTQPEDTEALRPAASPEPDPTIEPWEKIDVWTPASVGLAVALLLVAVVVVAVFALAVA